MLYMSKGITPAMVDSLYWIDACGDGRTVVHCFSRAERGRGRFSRTRTYRSAGEQECLPRHIIIRSKYCEPTEVSQSIIQAANGNMGVDEANTCVVTAKSFIWCRSLPYYLTARLLDIDLRTVAPNTTSREQRR